MLGAGSLGQGRREALCRGPLPVLKELLGVGNLSGHGACGVGDRCHLGPGEKGEVGKGHPTG